MVHLEKNSVIEHIRSGSPPADNFSGSLKALWYVGMGNWETARDLCQSLPDPAGARIHAYLHRVDGDLSNARYWYSRAGEQMPETSTQAEWEILLERAIDGTL